MKDPSVCFLRHPDQTGLGDVIRNHKARRLGGVETVPHLSYLQDATSVHTCIPYSTCVGHFCLAPASQARSSSYPLPPPDSLSLTCRLTVLHLLERAET